ncbi:MAG: peptide/nickel transport system ATP-binding protein [Kiritimatiellia bacterium]|jgi:peptide/nickel transport system ATP-binding protein
MTIWRIDGVVKRFHSGLLGRSTHTALRTVSIQVKAGERVGIIGESGSGKTTLARLGLGLLKPDEGSVHLFGEDTSRWTAKRWWTSRRRAQLLFQDPRAMLNPAMSIGTLLRESARLHQPTESADALVEQVLAAVELAGRQRSLPHQLSGGERRRVGVARVLLARPELVVADEPTAGLDAGLKADLIDLLHSRLGSECALVLISHDLPMVTWATERVVVMHRGEVVDRFQTDQLTAHTPHLHTAELLHAAGMTQAP